MNNTLHATLNYMIQSGSWSNPAMNTLLTDYVKYHLVFVIAGGCLVLILVLLSVFFWTQCKRMPKATEYKWVFEKKIYFFFGLLSAIVGLSFALIVAANATNAVNPMSGFSLLANSSTTSDTSVVGHALNEWIRSGNDNIPPIVTQKVQERVAWQRPKAIVCGVLLGVFAALSRFLWGELLQKTRGNESKWKRKEKTLFVGGITAVVLSLLMMVMVVANMQGAIAPITITVLGVGG